MAVDFQDAIHLALELGMNRPRRNSADYRRYKIEHLEAAVKSLDLKLTDDQIKAVEARYRPHAVKGH